MQRQLGLVLVACTACFSPTGPSSSPDVRFRDASVHPDAGTVLLPDGSEVEPPDAEAVASWDAAEQVDADSSPDASRQADAEAVALSDAAEPTDAGPSLDASLQPDASSPDAGGLDPAEWAAELVTLVPQREAECLGGSLDYWTRGAGEDLAWIVAGLTEGTVAFRSDLADACLEFLRTSTCDELWVEGNTCVYEVLRGQTPLGGACRNPYECERGAMCLDRCVNGTCVAEDAWWNQFIACSADSDCPAFRICAASGYCRDAPVGHDCSNAVCDGSSFCNSQRICEHRRSSGECQIFIECDHLHYCAQPDPRQPGTCQPHGKVGEPCDANNLNPWTPSGSLCDPGLQCRSQGALATCERLPALGEPCGGDASRCLEGWCDTSSTAPTCLPAKQLGEACPSGVECGRGSHCAGVCIDCGP